MPSPTTARRTNDAESVVRAPIAGSGSRNAILRAVLDLASTKGIDATTVRDVIERSGVARNTVYSHFGDLTGALAELWLACGPIWLDSTVAHPVRSARPSAIDRVLISTLAIAPRESQLAEVVVPMLRARFDAAGDTPAGRLQFAWDLASHVGVGLTAHTTPGVASVIDPIRAAFSIPPSTPSRTEAVRRRTSSLRITSTPPLSDPGLDDITGRLLTATVQVVGNVGLSAATMMRICRVAGVTTGAIAPRFSSLDDLRDRAFDASIVQITADNAADLADLADLAGIATSVPAPVANATYFDVALRPERRWWRRYRAELHVAALTDVDLAATLERSIVESNRFLAAAMESDIFGFPPKVAADGATLNAIYAMGFAVLDDLDLPIVGLNHPVPIELVLRRLFEVDGHDAPEF